MSVTRGFSRWGQLGRDRLQRQVINRRRLSRHSVMIHCIRTIRSDLHLEDGICAASAESLDRNANIGQVLGQTPLVNGEIDVIANPLWRKFHEKLLAHSYELLANQ